MTTTTTSPRPPTSGVDISGLFWLETDAEKN
jgi:hypothetical protein